jgi:type I restriction enzyme S subunit
MAGERSTIGTLLDATGGSIKTGPFGTKLKASEYTATGVPVISVGEVGFGRLRIHHDTPRVDETVFSRMPEFLLKAGDIVFGRKGAVERSAQVQPDEDGYFLGSDGIRIRLNVEECDPKFISYQLQTQAHRNWMIQHAAGTTMPSLNEGIILRIPIVLKPLAEQRAIAGVLGALDDKIELNRRMNATLESMARALFQSWFVDFDPVRAKLDGRQPVGMDDETAGLFPEHLEESPLGHIPKAWEVCSLASKIELLSGGTPKTTEPDYWDGEIPWYSVKDAPSETDVWVIQTEKQITTLGIENSAAQVLPEGTTIISARGTVGKLALVGTPMAMNQSCYGVRGLKGYANYFTYFSIRQATADLQQRTHGTVFDTITRQTFETLECIFPPAPLTQAFDRAVKPLLMQILYNSTQSHTLAEVRDTLLPKLLSGEISVYHINKRINKT